MYEHDQDEAWLAEAFAALVQSRDHTLRATIAARTDWLALRGARRFSDRGEQFDDLLQVARLGLLKAIDRFDPSFGVQFGGYATPTIMGELRRHFRDHTWSVHVSRRAKDLRPAVNVAVDEMTKELGRSPKVDELARKLQVPEDAVLEALEANGAYRTGTLDSIGGADSRLAVDGGFEAVINREVIEGLLVQLPPRQQAILKLRFFDELSQAQIAERIGTSQVHVGRLIALSLAELRTHLEPRL